MIVSKPSNYYSDKIDFCQHHIVKTDCKFCYQVASSKGEFFSRLKSLPKGGILTLINNK